MPASDSLFGWWQKRFFWFSASVVHGSLQYLGLSPQNFLHCCVPWWLPHQSSQGLFSRFAHEFCLWTETFSWPVGICYQLWSSYSSCNPVSSPRSSHLHHSPLHAPGGVHIHFLEKHLSPSDFPYGLKTSYGTVILLLFVHSHMLPRHLFYFLQALPRGCNHFWALLCQILWQCPQLQCAMSRGCAGSPKGHIFV